MKMMKLLLSLCLVICLVLSVTPNKAYASGLALDKNRLVHGFDSITNHNQVVRYIDSLGLALSQDRQLAVVSGTHGICPNGQPDKSQGCREISFRKEDFALFQRYGTYVQVVDYHNIRNWADFVNQHSNDYLVLAWCYSACWKGTPFYKAGYCPRDNSVIPSVKITCDVPFPDSGGFLPGSLQNP